MRREHFIPTLEAMLAFGERLARHLKGGEIFELVGDVGTGKTTLVKGLARGLAITDVVQSPTFTIKRVYEARNGLTLFHYDFYRLAEPGIMREELAESLSEPNGIIALEWDETVQDLLPSERTLRFELRYNSEDGRNVSITAPAAQAHLLAAIEEGRI